jgi:hypothetical protein
MDQEKVHVVERSLTIRQRTFVDGLVNGMKQTEAARAAGYAHPDVAGSLVLKRPRVQSVLQSALEEVGLDDRYLVKKLRELMEAESTNDKGNVVPNWSARARGLDLLTRIRGLHKPATTDVELSFEERLARLTYGDNQEVE